MVPMWVFTIENFVYHRRTALPGLLIDFEFVSNLEFKNKRSYFRFRTRGHDRILVRDHAAAHLDDAGQNL